MTVDEVAGRLGIDPSGISEKKVESNAWEDGVIVALRIATARGERKLSWLHVGQPEERGSSGEFERLYYHLGSRHVLPQEFLRKRDILEKRARAALQKYSFDTAWGRFVPYTAWASWKRENDRIKAEYLALKDEVARDYDEIVKRVLDDNRAYAPTAFERLCSLDADAERKYGPLEAFVENWLEDTKTSIPEKDVLTSSITYREVFTRLSFDGYGGADPKETASLRSELEATRKELEKARMRYDINRHFIEQRKALVDGFLADVQRHLYSMVYDVASSVLESLSSHGSLTASSSRSLRILVEKISVLDFRDDPLLHETMDAICAVLREDAGRRSAEDVKRLLSDVALVLRQELSTLGSPVRLPRALASIDLSQGEAHRARARIVRAGGEFVMEPFAGLARLPRS